MIDRWNQEIVRRTEPQRQAFDTSIARAQAAWCKAVIDLGSDALQLFGKLTARLDGERALVEQRFPKRSWWQILLFPSKTDFLRQWSVEWIENTKGALAKWNDRIALAVAAVEMTGIADNLPDGGDPDVMPTVPQMGLRLFDRIAALQYCLADFASEFHVAEPEAGAAGKRVRKRAKQITHWLEERVAEHRRACMPTWAECRRCAQSELSANWQAVAARLTARLVPLDSEWSAVARKCERASIRLNRVPSETYRDAFAVIAKQLGARPGTAERHRLLSWSFLLTRRTAAAVGS